MTVFLQRAGGILLCLLCGMAMAEALYAPSRTDVSENVLTFIASKRLQPVIYPDQEWTLFAAGDVMLSRFVAAILDRESVHYPYEEIGGTARSADIAFANFENPVGPGPRMPYEGLVFRADPSTIDGLTDAGFDVLSLANNHMSDAGQENIGRTVSILTGVGLKVTGAGDNLQEARTPVFMDAAGTSVAFLAYGDPRFSNQVHFADDRKPGIAPANAAMMKEDVTLARQKADVVVISLHAGIEYRETPDSIQQKMLHDAADAGADVVLGHHPHVIQPLEKRGDAWIIDSLGNLIFDQMWSEETRLGMVLQFRFMNDAVREIEAIPVRMFDYAQPRIAEGTAATEALRRLNVPVKDATVITWQGSEKAGITTRAMPLQEPLRTGFTVERTLRADLDGDRRGEQYRLRDGRLTVYQDRTTLWRSPADWWVQDMFIADVDGNRTQELILSAWKPGNYGSSRPFWVTEDDDRVRHHVFVYELRNGTPQPLWQSSNLPRPNCEMAFADLDGDGVDELIALEGDYTDDASCTATTVSIWKWENWGFYNQWKSEPGTYWDLRTEHAASGSQIVVNGSAK